MAKCFVEKSSLTDLGNKIREQSGETKQLVFPTEFINTVGTLENVTQEVNAQTTLIEQMSSALNNQELIPPHGYKEWIVTFPSRITSGEVVLVTDEAIAKHYTDAQAMAMMRYVGDESNIAYHDILTLHACNESMRPVYTVADTYGLGIYRSSSDNGITYQTKPLSNQTAIVTLIIAYASGELCYTPNTSRTLCNGDYKIQFWW